MDFLTLLLSGFLVGMSFWPGKVAKRFSVKSTVGLLPKDILPGLEQAGDIKQRIETVRKETSTPRYDLWNFMVPGTVVMTNGTNFSAVGTGNTWVSIASASSWIYR